MKLYYGLLNKNQLFQIIEEVCEAMKGPGEDPKEAIQLLVGTAAQETRLGTFKDPTPYRHGTGVFQLDPIGLVDIRVRPAARKWVGFCRDKWGIDFLKVEHRELELNVILSTIAARIRYKVVPAKIPETLEDKAHYYKKYYNSGAGKATIGEFLTNAKAALISYEEYRRNKT